MAMGGRYYAIVTPQANCRATLPPGSFFIVILLLGRGTGSPQRGLAPTVLVVLDGLTAHVLLPRYRVDVEDALKHREHRERRQ